MTDDTNKPRLYTVSVSFEFAVLADNEIDAEGYVHDAARDELFNATIHVTRTVRTRPGSTHVDVAYPDDYDDDTLIYGTDEDTTFGEAVAREKADERKAALAAKQADLFGKKAP